MNGWWLQSWVLARHCIALGTFLHTALIARKGLGVSMRASLARVGQSASKEAARGKKLRTNCCLTFAAALRHITRDRSQLAPAAVWSRVTLRSWRSSGLQTTCGDIIVWLPSDCQLTQRVIMASITRLMVMMMKMIWMIGKKEINNEEFFHSCWIWGLKLKGRAGKCHHNIHQRDDIWRLRIRCISSRAEGNDDTEENFEAIWEVGGRGEAASCPCHLTLTPSAAAIWHSTTITHINITVIALFGKVLSLAKSEANQLTVDSSKSDLPLLCREVQLTESRLVSPTPWATFTLAWTDSLLHGAIVYFWTL